MGQDTEQLSNEIAETRGNLSNHLDELQYKVSPSAIVDRKKAAARDRVSGVRHKVMGTASGATTGVSGAVSGVGDSLSGTAGDASHAAKQQFQGSPLAAGIAAFGLGMVIAALVPATGAESRAAVQVKDTLQDKAQPLLDDAKDAAIEVGQHLKETSSDAVDQVRQTGQDAAARVQDEGASSAQAVRSDAQY